MRAKVPLCRECARKLRAIREERGEAAMIVAMRATLCTACSERVNRTGGLPFGARPRFELDRPS